MRVDPLRIALTLCEVFHCFQVMVELVFHSALVYASSENETGVKTADLDVPPYFMTMRVDHDRRTYA